MKLKKNLFWNYLSLIFMAIAGLLMNSLIIYFYDSSVLGMFNETYAWYMILSQITVWGIHMSVLKYVPEQEDDIERGSILKSALFIAAIVSLFFIVLAEGLLFFLGNIPWKSSLQIAVAGLVFFSLNKIFLNYLNALSEMTPYAFFQICRYMLLIVSIIVISLYGLRGEMLAWIFPVTEGLIFVILFIYLYKRNMMKGTIYSSCIKKLFIFGIKILPSNMVAEMNTKVDVVCLGFLTDDTARIGVYSFAILFSEGFYQMFVTMRKMINPLIAKENAQSRLAEFMRFIQEKTKKYLVLGTAIAYVFVLCAYFLLYMFMLSYEYYVGIVYLAIVCFAIALNGKEIILGNMLAQAGYPLAESKLNMVTVLSNTIFNIVFISLWGTIGAAIATSVSYFVYGLYLKKSVKTCLAIDLKRIYP